MVADQIKSNTRSSEQLALPNQVAHLWKINLLTSRKHLLTLWTILSDDEKKRAKRFRFQKDKECFVISRGALRMLLGKYLQRKPSDITFEYGKNGKPSLPKKETLQFNVSHTSGMALIGFIQNFSIGVDVEQIKDDMELKELAQRFFSNNESDKLLSFSNDLMPQAFFNCWTRKEAFIKAKGDGLSFPLDQFEVTMAPGEKAKLLETHWSVTEKEKWDLYSFDVGQTYAAAMAVEGRVQQVEVFEW